jgi:hypothetical protein
MYMQTHWAPRSQPRFMHYTAWRREYPRLYPPPRMQAVAPLGSPQGRHGAEYDDDAYDSQDFITPSRNVSDGKEEEEAQEGPAAIGQVTHRPPVPPNARPAPPPPPISRACTLRKICHVVRAGHVPLHARCESEAVSQPYPVHAHYARFVTLFLLVMRLFTLAMSLGWFRNQEQCPTPHTHLYLLDSWCVCEAKSKFIYMYIYRYGLVSLLDSWSCLKPNRSSFTYTPPLSLARHPQVAGSTINVARMLRYSGVDPQARGALRLASARERPLVPDVPLDRARAGADDSLAEVWDEPVFVLNHNVAYV